MDIGTALVWVAVIVVGLPIAAFLIITVGTFAIALWLERRDERREKK